MAIDHLSFFETAHNQRAYIGTAAHRRSVAKSFGSFLDCRHQKSLVGLSIAVHLRLHARESRGADQSRRPGAEIFGGEISPHNFLDIDIYVAALYIDERVVTILILK